MNFNYFSFCFEWVMARHGTALSCMARRDPSKQNKRKLCRIARFRDLDLVTIWKHMVEYKKHLAAKITLIINLNLPINK